MMIVVQNVLRNLQAVGNRFLELAAVDMAEQITKIQVELFVKIEVYYYSQTLPSY
jgi:hypothetical protein